MPLKTSVPKSMLWAVIASANNVKIVWGLFLSYNEAQEWIDSQKTHVTTYEIAPYYPKSERMYRGRLASTPKRR